MFKKFCVLLNTLFVFLSINITTFATILDVEDFDTRHSNIDIPWIYNTTDGHAYRKGGVNTFDGVDCKNEKDTEQLENLLKVSGYVLVNTSQKEISDDEYKLLYNNKVYTAYGQAYFEKPYYANDDNAETHIYYERHILNEILRKLRSGDIITTSIKSEVATSTVIVDYSVWSYVKRAYTITNYFNNNIPSYRTDVAFMLIKSPINIRLLLQDKYEFTISELFVKADTPLLIKVPIGDYVVIGINDKNIVAVHENALIGNNQLTVLSRHTQDEPYVLELAGVINKYNIQPIDLDDAPDHSWENRDDDDYQPWLPTESTIIPEEVNQDTTTQSQFLWRIVFAAIAVLVILAIVIAVHVLKKKYREG